MTHYEIREKFLKFFSVKGGPAFGGEHTIVPSSSLLPTDPSVLFTTAGMQQFKPYYIGEADPMKDFGSLNTVSIQKSMRTSCIDEVGDETHLTFFEMLGNFSFGGYFKEKAIQWAHEFITQEMGLPISYVTIFKGSGSISKDEESQKIWQSLGVADIREEGMDDVFWGPTGNSGPCGPTTEIYCKNASGQNVEIWNIVFNEFFYPGSREELLSGKSDKKLEDLKTKGIDTGMGLERLATVAQGKNNIFETDLFLPLIEKLAPNLSEQHKRVIVDHIRAAVFLIADGVLPSNKEQGYVLRRLLRRVLLYEHLNKFSPQVFEDVIITAIENYSPHYPELKEKRDYIINTYFGEWQKFKKTLTRGLKELEQGQDVDASTAFRLYESYGLPFEVIKDIVGEKAQNLTRESFDEEFKKHQQKSRAGLEKKFGGHGLILDTGELKAGDEEELKKATRLHTATHLLHAALRKVLGTEIKQAGSDITAERLRFDFTFTRKVTPEEIKEVENLVNEAIRKDYKVTKEEMSYEDAIKSGALAFFKLKYPPKVNVYSVGDFSKELCGGPHVTNTAAIGYFKITKEESISAGIRRIRAVVN